LKANEEELKKLRDSNFTLEKQLKEVNDACRQKKMEFGRLQSTFKDFKVRLA
jgi:hypothetical protein